MLKIPTKAFECDATTTYSLDISPVLDEGINHATDVDDEADDKPHVDCHVVLKGGVGEHELLSLIHI